MQYRVTMTIDTDAVMPDEWPDVSVEEGATVSLFSEDPAADEELIGRVTSLRCEPLTGEG